MGIRSGRNIRRGIRRNIQRSKGRTFSARFQIELCCTSQMRPIFVDNRHDMPISHPAHRAHDAPAARPLLRPLLRPLSRPMLQPLLRPFSQPPEHPLLRPLSRRLSLPLRYLHSAARMLRPSPLNICGNHTHVISRSLYAAAASATVDRHAHLAAPHQVL